MATIVCGLPAALLKGDKLIAQVDEGHGVILATQFEPSSTRWRRGAVPVLVGWAAVRNDLAAPAWILFAVVFFWTPAHFWALALKYREDYAAAGIPMLPVVRGVEATARQIAGYAMLTAAATLALTFTGTVGNLYAISVLVLGAVFVTRAFALMRDASPPRAIRFFGWSNVYLMLVFVAVAVDTLVH